MKVIASLQGTVALRISADAVIPENGILQSDLIKYIGDRYQFAIRPNLPPQAPPEMFPNWTFRNGRFHKDSVQYVVTQIVELQNGDAVTAMNTDIADMILEDLIKGLKEDLKFRYDGVPGQKWYTSSLVVKFDNGFEEKNSAFKKIGEILDREVGRGSEMPFKPKALGFGFGDMDAAHWTGDINSLEKTDFSLQRRNGVPYSENTYFSNLPLPTKDHERVLGLIEQAL